MNIFKSLLQRAGLSHRVAAEYFGVSEASVKSWSSGRRQPSEGVMFELREVYEAQRLETNRQVRIFNKNKPSKWEVVGDIFDHKSFQYPSVREAIAAMVWEEIGDVTNVIHGEW